MKTLTRQLRLEKGLSQKALAQKALVTAYTIQVLEGTYPDQTVEPQHIQKVADVLGVDMDVLLGKKTRMEHELGKALAEGMLHLIECKTLLDDVMKEYLFYRGLSRFLGVIIAILTLIIIL